MERADHGPSLDNLGYSTYQRWLFFVAQKKFWYLYYQLSQRVETGGVAVSWGMPFLVSELLNRLFAGARFDLYWGGGYIKELKEY